MHQAQVQQIQVKPAAAQAQTPDVAEAEIVQNKNAKYDATVISKVDIIQVQMAMFTYNGMLLSEAQAANIAQVHKKR